MILNACQIAIHPEDVPQRQYFARTIKLANGYFPVAAIGRFAKDRVKVGVCNV